MTSLLDVGPDATAADWIRYLGLQPLEQEGGWYRETWRSSETLHPSTHDGHRNAATCIYYLLEQGQYSRLHVLPGPEIYCYHAGAPLTLLLLGEADFPEGREVVLGNCLGKGQVPQLLIHGGVVQAGRPWGEPGWSLVSTFMSPGFQFADYKEPDMATLLTRHPKFRSQILRHMS